VTIDSNGLAITTGTKGGIVIPATPPSACRFRTSRPPTTSRSGPRTSSSGPPG